MSSRRRTPRNYGQVRQRNLKQGKTRKNRRRKLDRQMSIQIQPNEKHRRQLQQSNQLAKKQLLKMKQDGVRQKVTPVLGTATQLLEKAKQQMAQGKYKEASVNISLAVLIISSYNPMLPDSGLDRGRMSERRAGIHAVEDGDTLLTYNDPLLFGKSDVTFNRREKREMSRQSGRMSIRQNNTRRTRKKTLKKPPQVRGGGRRTKKRR
tara:strand:- start:498 stop:1118 length:621 start_codon:yes stop_codon:yes gene_type:complete